MELTRRRRRRDLNHVGNDTETAEEDGEETSGDGAETEEDNADETSGEGGETHAEDGGDKDDNGSQKRLSPLHLDLRFRISDRVPVVLAASIVGKSGKVLVSRQFVDNVAQICVLKVLDLDFLHTFHILLCSWHDDTNLLCGEPLKLVDGGRSHRTFLYIKDAIEAVLLMIDNLERANGQIFNVGNPDNEVSVKELVELMIQVATIAWLEADSVCGSHSVAIPLVLVLPYLFCLNQCLRQYKDTREKTCLLNGKSYLLP
ncbi:hypothetical protein HN873_047427 [Arachis hypogaea]